MEASLLRHLLGRKTKSTALLSGLGGKLLRAETLLARLKKPLLSHLLGRHAAGQSGLFCRKTKLSCRLCLLCGELFCGKTQTTRCLRCPKLSFCALGAQGPGELSRLLGPSLLRLKGLLGALRGRFKTLSPELSRGPRLLLQYIPLTLCFLNPLSRAAKGPGAHCLGPLGLACDIALATDVRQRLVNDLLLVRAHELRNRSGVVHGRGAAQSSYTFLRGGRAHAPGGLELPGSFCGNASGARNSLLCLLRRRTGCAAKSAGGFAR